MQSRLLCYIKVNGRDLNALIVEAINALVCPGAITLQDVAEWQAWKCELPHREEFWDDENPDDTMMFHEEAFVGALHEHWEAATAATRNIRDWDPYYSREGDELRLDLGRGWRSPVRKPRDAEMWLRHHQDGMLPRHEQSAFFAANDHLWRLYVRLGREGEQAYYRFSAQ